jgi:hypothetical protein
LDGAAIAAMNAKGTMPPPLMNIAAWNPTGTSLTSKPV